MTFAPEPHPADALACFAITLLCLCTLTGILVSWWVH